MSGQTIAPMSWTVIDLLVEKISSLIGENGTRVLESVRRMDRGNDPSPEFVYRLGNELGELLGSEGAFAVIRQVGREIGREVTAGKDRGEALELLADTLRHLGFAYRIELEEQDAWICRCVFYDFLQRDGYGPVERPVCWAGWGFIEGCLGTIEGAHHITWKERDEAGQRCRFRISREALED